MLSVVDKAAVHLVNCYNQIMFCSKFGDTLQLGLRHYSPGGIIRVANQDHLCAWCNSSRNLICSHAKIVPGIGRYWYWLTTREDDIGFIGYITRIRCNDFMARIDQRA